MVRLGVSLACWLLKLPLSMKQRTKLVGAILEGLNAAPLSDIVDVAPDGKLMLDGHPVEYERAIQLRNAAIAALENGARLAIKEQVLSIAAKRGIVQGDTPEKLYFYRAAIWWGKTEEEILLKLASRE